MPTAVYASSHLAPKLLPMPTAETHRPECPASIIHQGKLLHGGRRRPSLIISRHHRPGGAVRHKFTTVKDIKTVARARSSVSKVAASAAYAHTRSNGQYN